MKFLSEVMKTGNLVAVMVAKHCDCTKKKTLYTLKWLKFSFMCKFINEFMNMNFMLCEFCLSFLKSPCDFGGKTESEFWFHVTVGKVFNLSLNFQSVK